MRAARIVSILFLVSLIPSLSLCQQQTTEVLTLDQVVKMALANNRLLKVSELEVEKAEKRRDALKTERYPGFTLRVLEGRTLQAVEFEFPQGSLGQITIPPPAPGMPPRGIPVPQQDTTITADPQFNTFFLGSASQPITQLYKIGLGINLHQLNVEISEEKVAGQRQTVVNSAKKMYFGILQLQSGMEATAESLNFFRELDRTLQEYVQQQTALKADSLEVNARLAKQEHTLLTIRNSLATLKEQLNNLLGRSIETEFRVSPLPEDLAPAMDLAEAQRVAFEKRPELKEARLKVKAAEMDRRLKKAEYIPDLSFVAGYLQTTQIGIFPSSFSILGLYLTWDPFDWGKKQKELAEKSRTITQANIQLKEGESLVLIDVNSKYRTVEEAKQLLGVTKLGQQAAREKLTIAKNTFDQQRGLLKDVLEAEASLAEKNNANRQATLSYWLALADLEKAIGEE